ncbi:MAG: hypothetical protein JWL57_1857, partial [Actinobacteria bacterium]|nr:hypothetical protein [Actinomycetota bacterium]
SWKVQVTLRSGLIENTAEALLQVPATSGPAQTPVRATPVKKPGPGAPVLIVAVVLVGAVSVGLALTFRRRRRQRLAPRGGRPLPQQRARAAVR